MFDSSWTDKNTPLWFIMLPTGHEGPYSLQTLEDRLLAKKLSPKTMIWREGLPGPLPLFDVLSELDADEEEESVPEIPVSDDEEIPPPLPPFPGQDDEELPEISLVEDYEDQPKRRKSLPVGLIVGLLTMGVIGFGAHQWLKGQEKIDIRRYSKMPPDLHKKIISDRQFDGFKKKIFFHEYVSPDLTHIWLVTSSFQKCRVDANFKSISERLLTMSDDEVEFSTTGMLSHHVVEFSSFDFKTGSRIVPGMYELSIRASSCEWEGLAPKIRNLFSAPDSEYKAVTRVVLHPRGSDEYNESINKLIAKKTEIRKQNERHENLFWEDLQMKYQTLHAMTLQIEQHFLNFLDQGASSFPGRLKTMVDQYTKKYGQGLTEFVVSNDAYFETLKNTDLRPLLAKKDYAGKIRLTSKSIGFESMKIIEKLQGMKKPNANDLKKTRAEVIKSFERLKKSLTEELLHVTEDRSTSP